MNFLTILFVLLTTFTYPNPVGCHHSSHSPTVPDAGFSQAFMHLGHVGVDYNVKVGTEVYAAMDGTVIWAGLYGHTYGRSVLILHCDGYMSLYGHLSELKTVFGRVVNAGDLIGLSGGDRVSDPEGAGASSGAHLHFEVRVPGHLENNLYNTDPLKYLEDHYFPPINLHLRNFQ